MNNRIQQLAEQAKASVPVNKLNVTDWIAAYNQKFAELIIKECADFADEMHEVQCNYPGDAMVEHFNLGLEQGAATWRTIK